MTKKKHAAKYVPAALALVLMLCLGMCVTALAAGTGDGITQAAITKNLQMDAAVKTPDATFTFTVEKVSLDGAETEVEKAKMPAIANQTVRFSSADTGTTAAGNRLKEVKKQTENIIPSANAFPHAGVYEYKVTEAESGYTEAEGTTMTYSQAVFTMEIYVKNGDSGLEIGGVYVNYVKGDDGADKDEKVDPTPGTDPNVSAWQFVNQFKKTSTLTISKTVAGAMGDKTKQFDFTLERGEKSALEADDASYNGTITRADGSSAATETTVTLTGTTAADFTLADNESLTITLPVGTTCTVGEDEDTATGYDTTATVTSNGEEKTGEINTASISVLTGEGVNSVAYTNTKNGTVPTGIIVDNLPFIILILAALCGFAGYIALKRRGYRS